MSPAPHVDGLAGTTRREWRERFADASARLPLDPIASVLGEPTRVGAQAPVKILMVCTGNICRSPMAEVVLRSRLSSTDAAVSSAGTQARVGEGMTDLALELSLRAGADLETASAHRARYLVEPVLVGVDLVLAMTREHRSHIVKMMPSRLWQTFTVREFARLSSSFSDSAIRAMAIAGGRGKQERFAAVLRAIAGQRSLADSPEVTDDVVDPYRRSAEVYAQSASQLIPALDEVQRVVRVAVS